ncbi:hypothetical protein ACRRTK_021273 [Alexandromys fortis]
MNPQRLWPAVLVALFIMPVQSLSCAHLDSATLKSVRLLGSVIQSPLKCLKDIQDFAFPKEILPHIQHVERDLKEVFYLASIQALNIFSQDRYFSPVLRERLEHIRMALFEQMWRAQDCFMDENKDSKIERRLPMYLQRVYLELNKYFIKIKKFLWVKKYSLCAWKIVGAEMRRCFMIFYKFKKLLKIQSDHSSSGENLK